MADKTTAPVKNDKWRVGITGMGRKSYIAVSGMGAMAAAQSNMWVAFGIAILALVGMYLQYRLDMAGKDEEK
jgi:hypothetical protein